jgi:hypothetical protein
LATIIPIISLGVWKRENGTDGEGRAKNAVRVFAKIILNILEKSDGMVHPSKREV